MAAVVLVEELDRHGEVLRRHTIERLPARIGRGYDADIIIDDPYVAAGHLEIHATEDSALQIADLGSKNGIRRLRDGAPIRLARIEGDDVFRIGRTQLRFRLPGQSIPAERMLPRRDWGRHPATIAGAAAILVALVAWLTFLEIHTNGDAPQIFFVSLIVLLAVLAWTAVWALVCRILNGSALFYAHGTVAFLGCALILVVVSLGEYINFAFDLRGFYFVWLACGVASLAVLLYGQLRLAMRLSPRAVGALAVLLATSVIGLFAAKDALDKTNQPGLQEYDKVVKPGVFLLVKGVAPEQFVAEVGVQQKTRVDKEPGAVAR